MPILLAYSYVKGNGSMIITDLNFDQAIKDNDLILVDFWAEWCGPCKRVSPVLDEISESKGLLVGKLNIDENPVKPAEYSIHSIPTMVLFKDGNPVHTVIGAKPKHAILRELAEWI
jgi:thioredoxin 1